MREHPSAHIPAGATPRCLPILFSAPMIRALLEGRKSQTRRLCKVYLPPHGERDDDGWPMRLDKFGAYYHEESPYGRPGDKLWVREEHYLFGHWEPVPSQRTRGGRQKWRFVAHADAGVLFAPPPAGFRLGRSHADPTTPAWHKRLARFMRRNLSRLMLEVTRVHVERLQDISETDAWAEGADQIWITFRDDATGRPHIEPSLGGPYRDGYRVLWESIHGSGSWAANPWVWVVEFRAVDAAR